MINLILCPKCGRWREPAPGQPVPLICAWCAAEEIQRRAALAEQLRRQLLLFPTADYSDRRHHAN